MTASVLAKRMLEGLSDTAKTELDDVLVELSQAGHTDLVSIFSALLNGQDLSTALNFPEGTVTLLYSQAHARFNAGHISDALGLFQALAVLAPTVKDHWLGLGICLRLSNSLAGARLAFSAAADLAPDCPAVTYHLAELAFAEGRFSESVVLLQRFASFEESPLKHTLSTEAQRLAAALSHRAGAA